MPEIGECYSIARKIPQQGICSFEVSDKFYKYINLNQSFKKLTAKLNLGQSFAYGKSIWFPFIGENQEGYIVMQLGMSGSFFLNNTGRENKNDHLIFKSPHQILRYSDPRMFGKAKVFFKSNKQSLQDLQKQIIKEYRWGLDPHLAPKEELIKALMKWQKSSKNIKSLMLEQNVIFGLGNYLCSEILNKAQISPYLSGNKLTELDLQKIATIIKNKVNLAIKTGGYSFAGGYFHPDGSKGQMARYIKAYDQEGKTCSVCKKGIIKKEFINTRSTFFCDNCQKNKKAKH